MAASASMKGTTIEVTGIDADWHLGTSGNDQGILDLDEVEPGIPLHHIKFCSGSTGNGVLVVKEGSDSGPMICEMYVTTSEREKITYFNGARKKPYIDYSEGTFDTGHSVIIEFM